MTTFEQARTIVGLATSIDGSDPDYVVADYGWENDDVYLIPAGHRVSVYQPETPEEAELLRNDDAPSPVVDKVTGEFSLVSSEVPGELPFPDMTVIGVIPGDES